MNQTLHSLIGKALYACKKRLFNRLRQGVEVDAAIAQFIQELQKALAEIAKT